MILNVWIADFMCGEQYITCIGESSSRESFSSTL